MLTETTTSSAAVWSSGVRVVATAVFAIAIVAFLVTSGVRWVTLGQRFYVDEFARYHVGRVTGLSDAELARVAQAFIVYFESPSGRLDVVVNLPQGPTQLLNEREITHMQDVQALMHRVFAIWTASILALLVSGLLLVVAEPSSGGRAVLIASAIGGGLAILIVGALGAASMIDFERLFVQFHMLSFTNDFWLLDPLRDRLIQLYPEGFFYDAALRIALETVGGGLILLAASLVGLRSLAR